MSRFENIKSSLASYKVVDTFLYKHKLFKVVDGEAESLDCPVDLGDQFAPGYKYEWFRNGEPIIANPPTLAVATTIYYCNSIAKYYKFAAFNRWPSFASCAREPL